jgi:hypothetical protein
MLVALEPNQIAQLHCILPRIGGAIKRFYDSWCKTNLRSALQNLPVSFPYLSFKEWNVEWLFLNSTTKTIKCPGDCPWKHKAGAILHLKSVASEIRAANADIIVLSEVQDCDVGSVLLKEIGDPTLRFHLISGTKVRAVLNPSTPQPPLLPFVFDCALFSHRNRHGYWAKCCVVNSHRPLPSVVTKRRTRPIPAAVVFLRVHHTRWQKISNQS